MYKEQRTDPTRYSLHQHLHFWKEISIERPSRHVQREKVRPSQSDTNHFGAGGVFELDLGDSEIPLTPKQESEQMLLEEQVKKKQSQSYQWVNFNNCRIQGERKREDNLKTTITSNDVPLMDIL